MTIPFKLLHAALSGSGIDLTGGVFEMLFIAGAEPDLSDDGWEFEADATNAGATILHRQVVPVVTFSGRTLAGQSFSVSDPGGAAEAAYALLVHQETGGNRIVAVQSVTGYTFDGANDTFEFDPEGIWRLGPAALPLVLAYDDSDIAAGTGGTWSVTLGAGGQPGTLQWVLVGGDEESPEYTPTTGEAEYTGEGGEISTFTPLFIFPDERTYTFALLFEGQPILTITRSSVES